MCMTFFTIYEKKKSTCINVSHSILLLCFRKNFLEKKLLFFFSLYLSYYCLLHCDCNRTIFDHFFSSFWLLLLSLVRIVLESKQWEHLRVSKTIQRRQRRRGNTKKSDFCLFRLNKFENVGLRVSTTNWQLCNLVHTFGHFMLFFVCHGFGRITRAFFGHIIIFRDVRQKNVTG